MGPQPATHWAHAAQFDGALGAGVGAGVGEGEGAGGGGGGGGVPSAAALPSGGETMATQTTRAVARAAMMWRMTPPDEPTAHHKVDGQATAASEAASSACGGCATADWLVRFTSDSFGGQPCVDAALLYPLFP